MEIDKKLYQKLDRDELLRLNAYLANKKQTVNHLFSLYFIYLAVLIVLANLFLNSRLFTLVSIFLVSIFLVLFGVLADLAVKRIRKEIESKYFKVELKEGIKKSGNKTSSRA